MTTKRNLLLSSGKNKITKCVILLKFKKFKRFIHNIYNFCMFEIILYDSFTKFVQP